jgi:DNA repair protein RecN (Recombination protein N)
MLTLLHIENVAVIEKLDMEFGTGFHVITGETGAGKSVLIDAINLVLGERSNRELIRKGQDKAYVCASFADFSPQVLALLEEKGITPDEDGNLLIEREITAAGRGGSKINGRPVSVSVLKELGKFLINIHGQHDNQALLHKESHLGFLDSFIGSAALLEAYVPAYRQLYAAEKELRATRQGEAEKARRMDLLQYQIDEIREAQLQPGEEEELKSRRDVLANSEKIQSAAEESYQLLYEGGEEFSSVHDMVSQALDSLQESARYEENLEKCRKVLENIHYELEDAVEYLRDAKELGGFDPQELEDIQNRLETIAKLKRKYGADIPQVLEYCSQMEEELSTLTHSEEHIAALKKQKAKALAAAKEAAQNLSDFRREKAQVLKEHIEAELRFLNMENTRFSVHMEKHTDNEGNPIYRPSGCDDVEFLIRTNKGEDFKPLAKIASGGELSRIMLAMKNIMTQGDPVGTLIFDEIDTGISGRAANRVAEKLREISRGKQVLCVSHLVSIAAKADRHYLISKDDSEHTKTSIQLLQGEERVREIARLISGDSITDTTLANARELLAET